MLVFYLIPQAPYAITLVLGMYALFSKIDEYERCFLLIFLIFRLLLRTDPLKSYLKKILGVTSRI
jgi:hypothetical protein